jgi:hypothetical protein
MSAEAERPQQRLEQMDTIAKGIISARPACGSVWFHRQARAAQKGDTPLRRAGGPIESSGHRYVVLARHQWWSELQLQQAARSM